MKICSRCKVGKELSGFYVDSRTKNPRNPCKECHKEAVESHLKLPRVRRKHNEASRIRGRGAELTQGNYNQGLSDLDDIFS